MLNENVVNGQGTPGDSTPPVEPASKTQTPSAETKKPEPEIKEGQSVPYARFKEVNDAKNAAEAKAKEFEDKIKTHAAGIAISETAMTDETFRDTVNKVINDYKGGKLTKKEANEEIKAAGDKVDNSDVSKIETRLRQGTVTQYVDAFESLAEKDFPDEKTRKLIDRMVTSELLSKHPKAADESFSQRRLTEAYNSVKEQLEGLTKAKMASYVKEKVNDQPPITTPGAAGSVNMEFKNHNEEARFMAKALKESGAFKGE